MIIFAADSATGAGSAALWKDGVVLAESYADVGLTHSQTLMELCDAVFRRAGIRPQEVDCYAVTGGPGSFTGLRIGMGTIQGMALAHNKPCVAVPTLQALAYNALGNNRTAAAVINARRARVFLGHYAVETQVCPLRGDAVEPIANLENIFSGESIVLIGDAAQLCYNELKQSVDCTLAPAHCSMPRASAVACLAAAAVNRGEAVLAQQLAPEYMQIPQAERERKEKGGSQ